MLRFILRRLGSLCVVLLSLALLVFIANRLGGGDPVRAYLGANASAAAIDDTRERLGLNSSALEQFWAYLMHLLSGDLGNSLITRRPIVDELAERLPATLELAAWTVVLAILIGVTLARVYALNGALAQALRLILFGAASLPAFLIAMGGVLLFFLYLDWLPVSGRTSMGASEGLTGMYVIDGVLTGNLAYSWDALQHLILPALAASFAPGVALARILSDGLSTGMQSGYARTARSLGESESSILRRHAFRNASSPALSLLAVQMGMMLSSLVVVEQIFSWNGLGQYLVRAISAADINSVATISLILGTFYVVVNTTVDIILAAIDPRVRIS